MRYFSLKGSTLSYRGSESDRAPWRTVTLRGCVIRHEGLKKGKFHVFSIYLRDFLEQGLKGGMILRLRFGFWIFLSLFFSSICHILPLKIVQKMK